MTKKPLNKDRVGINHKFTIGLNKKEDKGVKGILTLNIDEEGNVVEFFVLCGKTGTVLHELLEALSFAVNVGLRYGIPLNEYLGKFTNLRFPPNGKTSHEDIKIVKSVIDYIAKYIISIQSNGGFKKYHPNYKEEEALAKKIKDRQLPTACSISGGGCGS